MGATPLRAWSPKDTSPLTKRGAHQAEMHCIPVKVDPAPWLVSALLAFSSQGVSVRYRRGKHRGTARGVIVVLKRADKGHAL